MGTRRIKKSYEVIKTEKKAKKELTKKAPQIANDNYSYYTLIRSIRGFMDDASTYLRLKNQINKGKVEIIRNEMIDFNHKEWLSVINRFLNFIIKKYPKMKKDEDFEIMDNTKVVKCVTITKSMHFLDIEKAYGSNFKSKYPEVKEAMYFLANVIARFNVIEECVYSNNLKMDITERKNVRTILTKFNKYLRPTIMEIIKGR